MVKERLTGLDIFRVLSAFVIFMFHARMHVKCDWGGVNAFVSMGAIFMTAFFMLSGFSLFYTYGQVEIISLKELGRFYIKRMIGILPLYYIVGTLVILFYGQESLANILLLFPIEFLGLQSVYTSLFSYLHNGGTWFISCLLFCYLVYPFFQVVVKQLSMKSKMLIAGLCAFILLYSPIIIVRFSLANIYSNPFFRSLEFFIGVILASLNWNDLSEIKCIRALFNWKAFIIETVILVLCVSLGVYSGWRVNDYMMYSVFGLPMFCFMILTLVNITYRKLKNNKILTYLSNISYAFFLAQFFTWRTTILVLEYLNLDSNFLRISVSFGICMLTAVLLYEFIEKPTSKFLKRRLLLGQNNVENQAGIRS